MEQTLGKRIVMHRKRLGLTQEQLAETLGVTAQAVSKWENDQSCPDISMLPKLAQLFGTTVDALLGNDTQPVYEAEVVQPERKKNVSWEFNWDGGKFSRFGLAVVLVLLGIELIINSYLQRDLSFWELLWPTALFVFGIWGMFPKFSFFRFGCFLFGGYFLLDVWKLLPITLGSNIVFPVILVLLGLSVFADASKRPNKSKISFSNSGKQKYDYTYGDDCFDFDANFGSITQEINLPRLHRGKIDTSFGNYTIDLTLVNTVAEDCKLDVDCSFGQITLLVPNRFYVRNAPSTSFGNVKVIGSPDAQPQGTIELEADISFGNMVIQYV